ncbi:hypothetical protein MKX01_027609 [Papaver californicum]|nr:hypothetical protein MKX01_027609 [Papaver californicum]
MTSLAKSMVLRYAQKSHANQSTTTPHLITDKEISNGRRKIISTILTTSLAIAEAWGMRSFIKERFFERGLSPEDAVARIRQTVDGLHSIREMFDTMPWRYVIFYIRLKQAYLSQALKNATKNSRKAYFDSYIRTLKVYESYLYYEKTIKSLDELVELLTYEPKPKKFKHELVFLCVSNSKSFLSTLLKTSNI